jgi:hypothetical protein
MKTLTRYKSLLLAGGLLLICLTGLRLHKPQETNMLKPFTAGKSAATRECDRDPAGASYLKSIAGKLFPVLKNLNLM